MNKIQKTLLITGGLGGIGIEIVDFFYKKNFKIIILDNKSNNIFLNIFKSKTKNNNLLIYKTGVHISPVHVVIQVHQSKKDNY